MFARIKPFLAVLFLLSSLATSSNAQSPSPTPPNDRGLGVQSSTSRADQTNQQAREQKPELVLQTGYNSLIGGTRYLFSPDGRLLATGTVRSTTIKLWDTSNGRELRDLAAGGQSAPGLSPIFAFSRDSRMIAGAAGTNTVKIWDVVSGRELHVLEAATAGAINSMMGTIFIDFTNDGRLVTISDAIRIWDVATGRELRSIAFDATSMPNFVSGGSGFTMNGDGSQLLRVHSADKTDIVSLDLSTGREGRTIKISDDDVNSGELAVTPSGNIVAAGTVKKRLKLWDVSNRSEKDLGPTTKDYNLVKFSRDGRLLAYSDNYNAHLWDTATGRELSQFTIPHGSSFTSSTGEVFLALSEDGKKMSSGGFDTPSIVWDVTTAKQLFRLNGRTNMAYNVMFSADGNNLTSGGRTRWDLRTGRGLRIASGVPQEGFGWPSPDGRFLTLMRLNSNAVTVLETPSGRVLHTLTPAGTVGNVQKVRYTADSAFAIVTYMSMEHQSPSPSSIGAGSQVKVWDLRSGQEVRTLAEREMPMDAVPSRDGRTVAMIGSMGQITLWDNQTGTKLRDLSTSAMSKMTDMSRVMTVPRSGSGRPQMPQMPNMADIASMMTEIVGTMSAGTMGRSATSVAFSSDNRLIAVGGVESKSNIDVAAMMSGMMGQQQKGRKQKTPTDPQDMLKDLKVEPIGRIILWDAATGQAIATLRGHGKGVNQVAFSRDAKLLASAGSDNTIRIWDVASQRELHTMAGHTASIESMDFSPDGRLLASASEDGGTFLWDVNTGEQLLTLVSLDDGGEWMVVTPQGLFDGTPPAWNQILWRYNGDTFNVAPIEWFFNEFYYPGLLSDIFSGKRPQVAQDVSKKDRRQPVVKLTFSGEPPAATGITQRTAKVKIEITDAAPDRDNPTGSGARDVRLFRNGSLVKVWRGDVLKGQPSVILDEEITITAGPNRLVAYGFNKDNVKSKDAPLELMGADSLKRKGTAYIITVGINNYANDQYNLKYAVADAESFANEVRTRQNQIGMFEHVEVVSLLNENATKANILSALRRLSGAPGTPTLKATGSDAPLKKIEPEDTVIIYFAGHGTAQAQRFYLIPHDLGFTGDRTKLTQRGLQEILSHSISDLELEEMVEGLDAGHLLLVIDACNSGQALEAEEKRRGPMNSKGLAQLAYEKGMYILTAAQSYQAALEAAQLGHGLLTYALIEEGLKTPNADTEPKDGILIAREWLDFATDRVPLMQEEKMKAARGVGVGIAFTEGEKEVPDQNRTVQRPRVFYRREMEANPLVIAKP
ncbi:MAG TPA: caspase family protein [Pyrinomonadaceae bacterium]|nr:caspase family protein [Pyrinomonadaceae bacterium]